jgi:hypothetical protein
MIDNQLLEHPILPATRRADLALRSVVLTHLRRHARPGVTWEKTTDGLLIRAGGTERVLRLRNGLSALDEALQQLASWGCLRHG